MNNFLCDDNNCTGCSACSVICPNNAISLKKNLIDGSSPEIDMEKCVNCHLCTKVCPVLNEPDLRYTQHVFAAWSNNDNERKTSASGGIATQLYNYAINNKWSSYGVVMNADGYAKFVSVETEKELYSVRNSKYVFSSNELPYEEIANSLKTGKKVLFIGLPCQVAAIRKYLKIKSIKTDSFLCCDLICHGTSPTEYLNQHIKKVVKRKITEICFRDSSRGTKNFYFSLYDNKQCLYSKSVLENDVYQLGYHKALIYRDGCYSCHFAKAERVGDLTLGDFSGLGKKEVFLHSKDNVSCVLVNTDKGAGVVTRPVEEQLITIVERKREEAFTYEKQLIKPSDPHKNRDLFVLLYSKTRDFENAAKKCLRDELRAYYIRKYSGSIFAKKILRLVVNKEVRLKIKKVFSK